MNGVREVEYTDLEDVGRLARAEGWSAPTERDWRWLWVDNPAIGSVAPPRGWVLSDGDSIVGYVANIVQEYQLGTHRLLAATAAGLVVTPAFRGSSLQLMLAHARQRSVDLLLNTTAAPHVSKISEFLKFRRIPQSDYDKSLYWVLRAGPFARAALRKKGFGRGASAAGAPPVALMVGAAALMRGRGPARCDSTLELRTLAADAIGPQFDSLWRCRVSEAPRLLAVRDARTLRWHFAERGKANPPFLVCAYDEGRLVGYIAVVRQDAPHFGLQRARVADLFVQNDDPRAIRDLFCRACAEARDRGASMIEVVGFPARIRRVLRAFRPLELVERSWPFLYRTSNQELQQRLTAEDAWYASLFDGDGSL